MAENSGGQARPPLRQLAVRGSLWTLASTVLGMPLSLVATVVLARVLEPAVYGRLALLTFAISITSSIASLGIGSVFYRRISLAHGRDDTAGIHRALQMTAVATAWQMLVVTVVGAILLHSGWAIAILAVYSIVTVAWTPAGVLLIATNRSAVNAKIVILDSLASTSTQIIVATLTRNADLSFAAGSLAGSIPPLAMIWLAGDPAVRGTRWRMPRLDAADWRFALMQLLNGQLASLVFSQSEVMFFPGSRAFERGRFAAATTVGGRASLLIDSLFGSVAPALTTLLGRGPEDFRRGTNTLLRISTVLFGLLFPPTIVAATVATPYVFPDSFGDLRLWAVPLIVISLIQTAAQPALVTWTAQGLAGYALRAAVVSGVIDLVLSATLVPTLGLRGAVIASVASGACYLVWIGISFRNATERDIYTTYVATVLGATLLGLVASVATTLGTSQRDWVGVLSIPVAGFAGLALVLLTRPLRRSDLELLQHSPSRVSRAISAFGGRLVRAESAHVTTSD